MASSQHKSSSSYTLIKNITDLGTDDNLSPWDNQKTRYLNFSLLVALVSSLIFTLVNLLFGSNAMVLAGTIIMGFNFLLFYFQYLKKPYLTRILCSLGYPLAMFSLIVLSKGNANAEYVYFIMMLLSVIFFRKWWRQLMTTSYIAGIYILGEVINAQQQGVVTPFQKIFNNTLLFLAAIFTLIIITNLFIREILATRNKNKRLLQELSTSNQELKRLNYMVSHDLRTPLRQIVSFSDLALISNNTGDTEAAADYIQEISTSARNLYVLTDELLSLAFLDNDQFEQEELLLEDIFAKTIQRFTGSEHTIRFESDHQGLRLKSHPSLIGMLLQNLVENGIKYNQNPQKHIQLKATQDDHFLKISVTDNGIGINPVYQEKIFEAFQRLHFNNTYQGSGLGLAIAKKIMDLHGGKITMEPQPTGAKFVLHFPQSAQNDSNTTDQTSPSSELKVSNQVKQQSVLS